MGPTIHFHGIACFSVHHDDGILVFDPHDGESVGLQPPAVKGADVVLCSHDHYDHASGKELVAREGASILVGEPGTFSFGNIRVVGVKVPHGLPEIFGTSVVYTASIPGAGVFTHCGDLGVVPGSSLLERILSLGRPDVIFVPIGGKYTVSANDAMEIAQLLSPARFTVACHYLHDSLAKNPDFSGMVDEHQFLELAGDDVLIAHGPVGLDGHGKSFVLFDHQVLERHHC